MMLKPELDKNREKETLQNPSHFFKSENISANMQKKAFFHLLKLISKVYFDFPLKILSKHHK